MGFSVKLGRWHKWQQRIRAGRAKYNVQLEKLPRSSETCSKSIHLTVNHEQSLFNCLTILFSSIFIHILGVLQISFISLRVRER